MVKCSNTGKQSTLSILLPATALAHDSTILDVNYSEQHAGCIHQTPGPPRQVAANS